MRYLLLALLLALLLPATALAEEPTLLCTPVEQVHCDAGSSCQDFTDVSLEVSFQPEPIPRTECRALSCEPDLPTISVCGFPFCGAGTVHYSAEHAMGDSELRLGIAYLAPDPPPRLYASTHFALAYDTGTGRLALSRFDGTSMETSWLDCAAE
jgi:hypothetical protein